MRGNKATSVVLAESSQTQFDLSAVELMRVSHDPILTRMLDPEIELESEIASELEAHGLNSTPEISNCSNE
jgi:hypothetical protein